jgi:glycosyltransferase involved in cell wall biosynthesis
MATYNGEKYLYDQMISIVNQLRTEDEVIVVDDCSSDSTVKILRNMDDKRIKIFANDRNMGHVFSFGHAISKANNDIIFMSDQDDVWKDGRVALMVKRIVETDCLLISTNTEFMDINSAKKIFPVEKLKSSDSDRHMKNILSIITGKTGYYGCAMAFRKQMTSLILPIPTFVESHDLWIALASNLFGANAHLEEKTLIRRVHENNASIVERCIYKKLWSRWIFFLSIVVLTKRIIGYKYHRL